MDGSTSFWLGAALAIPVGIGVNLATPHLQAILGQHSSRWRNRIAAKKMRDEALASWLTSDQSAMIARASMAIMDALQYAFTSITLFVATLAFIWLTEYSGMTFSVLAVIAATAGLMQFLKLLNHIRRVRRIGNEINAIKGWPLWGDDPRDVALRSGEEPIS
jgi:hypothetical protein